MYFELSQFIYFYNIFYYKVIYSNFKWKIFDILIIKNITSNKMIKVIELF